MTSDVFRICWRGAETRPEGPRCEACRAQSGGGVLGEKTASGVRGGARAAKWFYYILSTQDCLSLHLFNVFLTVTGRGAAAHPVNSPCLWPLWCESVCTLTGRLTLKIGKGFSTSLHLWFCIRVPITTVIGLQNLFQNTDDPAIVIVVQINNMIAHFTILFVLTVLGKFVQTPQVLCD